MNTTDPKMKRFKLSFLVASENTKDDLKHQLQQLVEDDRRFDRHGTHLLATTFETTEIEAAETEACEHRFVCEDDGMQSGEPYCVLCGVDEDEVSK